MEATTAADPAREAGSRGSLVALEVGAIGLVALVFRLVDLGHPPFVDELNHVLAAGSLLRDGTLTIHEGVAYDRGRFFTWLVAGSMALFGRSLEAARLPALASGVLLVCVLFAWLRAEAGRVAAWTGGLLLAFSPVALYLSQWVRFYTLHALTFWLAAWGVYRLVGRADSPGRRWWITAVSLVALLLATHLQVTTVVGSAGLALFVVLMEGPRWLDAIAEPRRRWIAVGAVAGALLLIAGIAGWLGVIDWLAERAARVDVWAIQRADNPRFYHWLFTEQYGFLWVLFPFAVLVALAGNWRPALLFTVVFAVAFGAQSLAAWKAERYVFYVMPAWFAVWGLAAAQILPWLWSFLEDAANGMLRPLPRSAIRGVVGASLLLAIGFAASGLPAYTTSRLIYVQGRDWSPPQGYTGETYRGHPDWARAAQRLVPLADSVDVLVAEPDLKAVYYLGDVDFVLYAGHLLTAERGGRPVRKAPEFSTWSKVGRPLVSTPASIERIMACYASGMIVAEAHVWEWSGGVPPETAELIERATRPVDLPPGTGLLAFRWGPEASGRAAAVTEAPETAEGFAAGTDGAPPRCNDLRRTRREAPVRPAA